MSRKIVQKSLEFKFMKFLSYGFSLKIHIVNMHPSQINQIQSVNNNDDIDQHAVIVVNRYDI